MPASPLCPVALFKKFSSLRFEDKEKQKQKMYLGLRNAEGAKWFTKTPMGVNVIDNLFRSAAVEANCESPRRLTNTSARKFTNETLAAAHVGETARQLHLGQKPTAAIGSYQRLTLKEQKSHSNILNEKLFNC